MAVLGAQIVITMIAASLLSKLGSFFSFARFLLVSTGLSRYLHPSDEELRTFAQLGTGAAAGGTGGKRNRRNEPANNLNPTFNVPRSIGLVLEKAPVVLSDVVQLRYYEEYQWLVDMALCASSVYGITEVYIFYFGNKDGINLSMIWSILTLLFAYKILISLNGLYFSHNDNNGTGERALVIMMGFVYLLLAMVVLIIDEDVLETGLDDAYSSFNNSAGDFLARNTGLDSQGVASKLVLKFFLALWAALVGALFTFPGLRVAKMHWDIIQDQNHGVATVLSHIAFVSPLILSTLWIKPFGREYLTERTFKGMDEPFMSEAQFETFRLYSVLFVILLRMCLMPKYLQTYLNMAHDKVENLKQEAGKISNVELQKLIVRVFYYLCVVALQYITPMILITFYTLMYKTMGGGSWTGTWIEAEAPSETINEDDKSSMAQENFSLAWHSLKTMFTPAIFKGLLGFSTWWCNLVWFASSAIGITYQSYFDKM